MPRRRVFVHSATPVVSVRQIFVPWVIAERNISCGRVAVSPTAFLANPEPNVALEPALTGDVGLMTLNKGEDALGNARRAPHPQTVELGSASLSVAEISRGRKIRANFFGAWNVC